MYSPPSLVGIRPRRFGLVPWSPHIAFGYDLVADLRPRILVELGTQSGESYFAFCQSVAENRTGTTCYAVDPWLDDSRTEPDAESVYADVRAHNQEYYERFSTLVRAGFDEARARFADGSVDLLHFNFASTYDRLRHDVEMWRGKLSGRGVALFHNIGVRQPELGAWKCWEEIRSRGDSFEFTHGRGLGVWKPPGGTAVDTPLLRALFSASAAQAENLRHYYRMATDALRQRAREAGRTNGRHENGSATGNGTLALSKSPGALSPVGTSSAPRKVQVAVSGDGDRPREHHAQNFPLTSDRWERIEAALPEDWSGKGLRISTGGAGLTDIAGVRIVSTVLGEVVWELRGRDLLAAVQILGDAEAVPDAHVLRLVSLDGDARILLPEIDLQGRDEPLRVEIGIRLRTDFSTLGKTLRDWARELREAAGLRARERDALRDLEAARESGARLEDAIVERERRAEAMGEELAALKAKLQGAEEQRAQLLARSDQGRPEDNARIAELADQLTAAEARANVLAGELEAGRAQAREQAATFYGELAALRAQEETLQAEAAAKQAQADTRCAELQAALEDASHRLAALEESGARAQERGRVHAEQLCTELEAVREEGRRTAAELRDRLALEQARADSLRAPVLQEELAAARARANALEDELTVLRQTSHDELAALEEQWQRERASARQQNEEATAALAYAEERTNALLARLELPESSAANPAGVLPDFQQVCAQLAQVQNQLLDTEAELRELREEKAQWEQDREYLHQEISGLHSELQAQDETLVNTGREHADTYAALLETRQRAEADHGRLESMRQSASWKLTLPLRVAGRAVTGKKPAGRNGTALARMDSPLPTAADMAQRSGGYHFQLDGPADWNLPGQQTRVRGWCLPPPGKRLPTLRLRCGDLTYNARCDVPRPDVQAAHGGNPEWHLCGFDVKINVPGGPSQLAIEAIDEAGTAWLVGQYKVRAPYAAWARQGVIGGNPAEDYATWIDYYDALSAADRRRIRAQARELPYRPLISVVMPVYNTPEKWLAKAIDSVRRQLYPYWELCIADDCSPKPHVREFLARYQRLDSRIKVCFREKNGHISAASNSALELATGEFVALLDHDDELAMHALYAVALELQDHPEADLIYSDEDKLDEEGRRFSPYFKPRWNPDLLLAQNFISHLGVYRRETIEQAGGFRVGYEGCQDWDLALRIVEQIPASHIRHIPRVLYHWRAIEGSTARAVEEKDYIVEASRRVLQDHCERTGQDTEITSVLGSHFRVRFRLPASPPLVSIIIPTHNQPNLLRQGIEALRAKTTYPRYEILVVDNRSDNPAALAYLEGLERAGHARVLRYPKPFNYSAINNFAVEQAHGELVCLMNNDMEVISPDWLEEMASHALRPGIGAVGAILYYPDDTIQHAGVVLGLGGVAGHLFSRMPRGTDGYFNRARVVQNFTAVTAACLVVQRAAYREVGGLNETLKVAFNDVDFCLKLYASGRRNLWTPHAEFYHHESASRGAEDTTEKHRRFVSEVEYMQEHWHHLIADDPAYNLNLGTEDGECRLASPPRVPLLRTHAVPERELDETSVLA